MKKTLFLYSGEGTRDGASSCDLLKHSRYWSEIEDILFKHFNVNLEEAWNSDDDPHRCPTSPLLTVATGICLTDIWEQWGYHPDVVTGHSIGELTAAYRAGLYSLEEIFLLTYEIGAITAHLDGAMAHGTLTDQEIGRLPVNLTSLNFTTDNKKHVTVSGYVADIEQFLADNPKFSRMKPSHPWHHPDYHRFFDQLRHGQSARIDELTFVSGVTTNFEQELHDDHWRRWLVQPIDFIGSMETISNHFTCCELEVIEIGSHPVLADCCRIFPNYQYASSMFRGEDEYKWILHQRQRLDGERLHQKISRTIHTYNPDLNLETPLAYQGLTSSNFLELSEKLQPYFPSLAPQDFYRYKSINQLISQFRLDQPVASSAPVEQRKNEVVISGMSCRFPSTVETPSQFWTMLMSKKDQVKAAPGRGNHEAGYLGDEVTRFDHQYFNISEAEAQTMDPQQILALELTEMLFRDAGIDPQTLDRKRVGVYIGVWNQEYSGRRESVFYPSGTNPSIIASRISYHYDLRGPSWVSNTACSSSLVAVHYAQKDIEAGRIDFAIAGGVNMLLGNSFTDQMKNSGFLSDAYRCKAFDNSADGYVRAEGGGLVLLANKALTEKYYVELIGSSVNQNGGRSQIMTAPHSEAQEELIIDACTDAGITPSELGYIECHGTGTKIGDPIEITAIQNIMGRKRKEVCHLGSVKSNMGHLESAAGIAGLIKSILILNYGIIPPNLHFDQPNQYIDFASHNLHVVDRATTLDTSGHIGISSFGFGGTNAHIIIKGVQDEVRKPVEIQPIPFDRERARPLSEYFQLDEQIPVPIIEEPATAQNGTDVRALISKIFGELTGIDQIDPDLDLTDQGLNSMSATQLLYTLEKEFHIELEPDILFRYPLLDQFVAAIESKASADREADYEEPVELQAAG